MRAAGWSLILRMTAALAVQGQDLGCDRSAFDPLERKGLDAMEAREYPLAEQRFFEQPALGVHAEQDGHPAPPPVAVEPPPPVVPPVPPSELLRTEPHPTARPTIPAPRNVCAN